MDDKIKSMEDEIKKLNEEIETLQNRIKTINDKKDEEFKNTIKTYQDLKNKKQEYEDKIKKLSDPDIIKHLLEERRVREEEIKRLREKGKDETDPEIREYLTDIEKINNELARNKKRISGYKSNLTKTLKYMGKLEAKYGKDKLDKFNKQSTTQQNPTQTDPAQTATQQDSTKTTSQDLNQTAPQQNPAQTTSQDPAQTATQQDTIETIIQDSAQTSAVNIDFSSKGIFVDGKMVNIKETDNIHDFIESEKTKANGNVTLNFDLRGMSFLSKILKTSILTGKQIDQIKDLAFQNRENSNINNDVFTNLEFKIKNLEFKIKDTIKKIKQKKLPNSSSKNDTRQASTSVDSSTQDKRKIFLDKIRAKIDKSKQGLSSKQNNKEKSNTIQNNQNRDEGR